MKKITFCVLAASFILSVIPTQVKAATESNPVETTVKTEIQSAESNVGTDRLNEIKSIELSSLGTSTEKETLKEVSPLQNEQGRHQGRYHNRQPRRDVDVTIQSERSYGHRHGGAYIGGGGVLILILILILVL